LEATTAINKMCKIGKLARLKKKLISNGNKGKIYTLVNLQA